MGTEPRPWRSALPVLVTEAQTMGSIAVIRSLGRAGYPVHAAAARADALGLGSRFSSKSVLCPESQGEFIPWLREYVRTQAIRAIIPSEKVLLHMRPCFAEFAPLLPFAKCETLYAGLSKFDLFSMLQSRSDLARHLPPTLLVPGTRDLPSVDELAALGRPLYIKTDGTYAVSQASGSTYKRTSPALAREQLQRLAPEFRKIMVQGHVPGEGVGAFFLLWDGKLIAEFMHHRLHEVPHTGGVSSLRESWWHQAIRDDALQKLRALNWQGVAMLEYRWRPETNDFYLMEMNGRFWGSLHLALYAGVDFPELLLDCFHGHTPPEVHNFQRGLRCRNTFPMEVQYVWSRLKDGELGWGARMWSVAEFFTLMLDPRVRSDMYFPGDRGLYWDSVKRFLAKRA